MRSEARHARDAGSGELDGAMVPAGRTSDRGRGREAARRVPRAGALRGKRRGITSVMSDPKSGSASMMQKERK